MPLFQQDAQQTRRISCSTSCSNADDDNKDDARCNKGKRNKRPKLIVTETAAPEDDANDNANNEGRKTQSKPVLKVLKFADMPPSVRVHVYNYRGETQEEMIDTMLISKQAHSDCHPNNPCLEWTITPTLTIGPLDKGYSDERDDFQRTTRFLRNLHRIQQDETKRRILQNHRKIVLKDTYHEFGEENGFFAIRNGVRGLSPLTGIISLDASSKKCPWHGLKTEFDSGYFLLYALSFLTPNLREFDCSADFTCHGMLFDCMRQWTHLEKITWNCIPKREGIRLDGSNFLLASVRSNLREVIMDTAYFVCESSAEIERMNAQSNDESEASVSKEHIFHRCFHKHDSRLERLSIRNATPISQNMLMKFVRNAPLTLTWFRSNLSPTNMDTLRSERPGIEFVN